MVLVHIRSKFIDIFILFQIKRKKHASLLICEKTSTMCSHNKEMLTEKNSSISQSIIDFFSSFYNYCTCSQCEFSTWFIVFVSFLCVFIVLTFFISSFCILLIINSIRQLPSLCYTTPHQTNFFSARGFCYNAIL